MGRGALIGLLVMLLCWVAQVSATGLTLVYSGNLDGELEPCGCSAEGDLGGLQRHATVIDRLRAEIPDLILLSSGGLLAHGRGRNEIRNRFVLTGTEALDYDAIGLQWPDLFHGEAFLEQATLPLVASNWRTGRYAESRAVERPGVRLRYFQWLDPQDSPYAGLPAAQRRVSGDPAALGRAMTEAREAGALVVLGSTLPLDRARTELPLEQAHIYIEKAGYEQFAPPRRAGDTLVLQPGSRGQRLGRLDLVWRDGRVVSWEHEIIAMPESVPDAPRLAAWYEAYNAAQAEDYRQRVAAQQEREQGEGPYLGAAGCAGCHADIHAAWQGTVHADALARLEENGKDRDPDCVGCHSVGFLEPGGFLDRYLTPGLADVQCESCHGAGRAHAEAAGQVPTPRSATPAEQICRRCHVPGHSPGFELDAYRARLAHP